MADLEIKFANQEDKIKWDNFVEENNGTLFQTFEWKEVIEKSFGYKPYYFYAEDSGIKAILPSFLVKSWLFGNKLISVPCGDAAGLLGEISASRILVDELVELGTKLKIDQIEIHNLKQEYIPKNSGFIKPWDYFSFILDINKPEKEIYSNFPRWHRKILNKVQKKDIKIKEITTVYDMDAFYKIYCDNMHFLGTPPLSFNFFRTLFKNFYPKNFKGYAATYNQKPIGGTLFLFEDNVVRLYSAMVTSKYRHLNSNTLLIWEGIKSFCNKYKYLDFGGSRPNSGNFEFKRRWGAGIVNRDWRYKFFNKSEIADPRTEKFQIYSRMWKKLPLPMCNFIGPYIRKSMGR